MRSTLALVLGLILLGAGCAKTPELAPYNPPTDRTSTNLEGDLNIEAVEIQKTNQLNDQVGCRVNLSYPRIANDTLPPQMSSSLNQSLIEFLSASLQYANLVPDLANPELVVTNHLDNCLQQVSEEFANLDGDFLNNLQYSAEATYHVKLNQHQLLSLGLEESSYTGGAHPGRYVSFLTFDLAADKQLTIGDLIAADKLEAFSKLEKTRVLSTHQDDLYQDAAELFTQQTSDAYVATPDELALISQNKNFYLTPTALVIFYNSYDIAPYAAGPIEIELTYAELQALLASDSPLLRMTTSN